MLVSRATAAPLPRVLKPAVCLSSPERRSLSLICQALGCEFRPAGAWWPSFRPLAEIGRAEQSGRRPGRQKSHGAKRLL